MVHRDDNVGVELDRLGDRIDRKVLVHRVYTRKRPKSGEVRMHGSGAIAEYMLRKALVSRDIH